MAITINGDEITITGEDQFHLTDWAARTNRNPSDFYSFRQIVLDYIAWRDNPEIEAFVDGDGKQLVINGEYFFQQVYRDRDGNKV